MGCMVPRRSHNLPLKSAMSDEYIGTGLRTPTGPGRWVGNGGNRFEHGTKRTMRYAGRVWGWVWAWVWGWVEVVLKVAGETPGMGEVDGRLGGGSVAT
jgi:hypothetical protein